MGILDTIKDVATDLMVSLLASPGWGAGALFGCSSPAPGSSGYVDTGAGVGDPATEPDAGEAPQCDTFARTDAYSAIEDRSYRFFNYVWDADAGLGRAANWHPRARVYAGAAAELFESLCLDPDMEQGEVKAYMDAMRARFSTIFSEPMPLDPQASLDASILMLLDGFGPCDVQANVVKGAFGALAEDGTGEAELAKIILAGQLFNAVAEGIGLKDRYSDVRARSALPGDDVQAAKARLAEARELLAAVDATKLNDDLRIEYLRILGGAIDTLEGSLRVKRGGGGGGGGDGGGGGGEITINEGPAVTKPPKPKRGW
jgi:hypothetical protein